MVHGSTSSITRRALACPASLDARKGSNPRRATWSLSLTRRLRAPLLHSWAPRGLNWPRPGPTARIHAVWARTRSRAARPSPAWPLICGSPSARCGGSRPIRVSVPWRGPRLPQITQPRRPRDLSRAHHDTLQLATVLAVIKVRPGDVGASSAVSAPADLDHVCARRPANPRSGRRKACGAVEQKKEPRERQTETRRDACQSAARCGRRRPSVS